MNYKEDLDAERMIDIANENPQDYFRSTCEVVGDAYFKSKYRGTQYFRNSAISSVIQVMNLMEYKVGVELGVSYGHSTVNILKNCKSLKKLYAIDSYQPYVDYYTSNFPVDKYDIEIIKNIALKTFSGLEDKDKDKLKVVIQDSDIVVDAFKDEELDFVFLDAHLNSDHIKKDLEKWYPKVRSGGMVAIHDTNFYTVYEEVELYMKKINFSGKFSNYDSLACLIK